MLQENYISDIFNRTPTHILVAWMKKQQLMVADTRNEIEEQLLVLYNSDQALIQRLYDWHREHLIPYGEKIIILYKIDKNIAAEIIKNAPKFILQKNQFSELYPQPVKAISPEAHQLCHIENDKTGCSLVFGSVTKNRLRVDASTSELNQTAIEKYGKDAEVVIYKQILGVFYDIFKVNYSGLIELRIDNPCLLNGVKATTKSRLENHIPLKSIIQSTLSEILGRSYSLPKPINIFPCVNALYSSRGGRVKKLLFQTSDGGTKTLQAPASLPDYCLKSDDTYHINGELALKSPIVPYRIIINWLHCCSLCGDAITPEIYLPGTIYHLRDTSKTLNYAIFNNVGSVNAYNLLLNKLIQHIHECTS